MLGATRRFDRTACSRHGSHLEWPQLGEKASGSSQQKRPKLREPCGTMLVAPLSVMTQVSRPMTKVQARDRTQLVAFAYRGGLVR